jgi:hypothetical protein
MFPAHPFKSIPKNYGLSLALMGLFIFSWGLQAFFQWKDFTSQQLAHGLPVLISGYLDHFFSATFENWQSEFLQLFTMVILSSILVHKGSPQSKDSTERMERNIEDIQARMAALETHLIHKDSHPHSRKRAA